MTKAEAVELRKKWQLQASLLVCEHPIQEFAASEDGYLTGNSHCTTCGNLVAKKI